MGLSLARTIAQQGRYDPVEARKAYVTWLHSDPFDCGSTVYSGLAGRRNPDSQANGALMRISPLGIFGTYREPAEVAEWARQDAALTHPHPVCIQANALFTRAIAHAIRTGCDGGTLYREIVQWAENMNIDETLLDAVVGASIARPRTTMGHPRPDGSWSHSATLCGNCSMLSTWRKPWWTPSCAEATPTPTAPSAAHCSVPWRDGTPFPRNGANACGTAVRPKDKLACITPGRNASGRLMRQSWRKLCCEQGNFTVEPGKKDKVRGPPALLGRVPQQHKKTDAGLVDQDPRVPPSRRLSRMRRWRQERSLILKRWAEEKQEHLNEDRRLGKAQASFEHCHCSAGPGLMRKARPGDRPPDRFHRHVVAHSNNERRLQDRTEVAAQLQIEDVRPAWCMGT